ncbi:MAG: ATP-binding protein [Sphaerochaeta sp.]|nr:MAG: ATP-binding protein [Sphaerochaeta sp.]
MLLEFRMKNYKSFKDECVFSMRVAPKQKGLDYSILTEKIGRNDHKALSSAVIYGPNASGKTNIIGAMETFKEIVLRGNIRNTEVKNSPNAASSVLELIPNNTLDTAEPVDFSVIFTDHDLLFDYSISLDLGRFLERDHKRKVLKETLRVNDVTLFSRNDTTLQVGDMRGVQSYLFPAYAQNAKNVAVLAESSLNNEELFLANGFKTMFSSKLALMIAQWMDKNFVVIYRSDSMQLVHKFSEPKKQSVFIEKTLNDAATLFGVNSNALGYVLDGEHEEAQLCSIFKGDGKASAVPVELFESFGTIRFINLFPLILQTLRKGGVLVVDEFDASIHPMALMNIITVFHNDELNTNNAQLIFNTHNPIFLNSNLFRRDEIKFVDRDDETHCSIHYSLSDFGTAGAKGVRKGEDYMKNYFVDRYGAIKSIDFASVIKNYLEKNEGR